MQSGKRILLSSILASFGWLAFSGAAWAADYPVKPIEIVVPVAPGGGTDMVARAFVEAARKYLPQQPFVVTNKPGASGAIGMAEVANAKPDGYKLGLVIVEMTILPHMGLAKFTVNDFKPIARLNADPAAITVRADAPWNTIEEFITYARSKPGGVQMGEGGGAGNIWNLAAVAFEEKAQIKVNHVPFMGASPAVLALLGGHVEAVSVSPGEVAQHVAAGKLKTLAVMSDKRWGGLFEKVPTLKERNIDVSVEAWRGLAAPKDTPAEIVDLLRGVAQKAAADPVFRDTLAKANLGWSYADADGFRSTMTRDHAFFGALVPKLGLKN